MCILIHQPKGTSLSTELLHDFNKRNSNGFGAMKSDGSNIHISKTLGNINTIVKLYKRYFANEECLIHFRMKTHGDIDQGNCHPYAVTDSIWMAHNGILAMGNNTDTKKSDTWHFIKHFLRPTLSNDPSLLENQDWLDYVGDTIGSTNKFGFMRNDGHIALVNEHSGIKYKKFWLSNTYAWSAHKFGAIKKQKKRKYNYNYSDWNSHVNSYNYQDNYSLPLDPENTVEDIADTDEEEIMQAWADNVLREYIKTDPEKAIKFCKNYSNATETELRKELYISVDYIVDRVTRLIEVESEGGSYGY
tara:strand:+ start:2106 stop:3014 length:909 start_codon:yes stop_codon:yes gene_type:complete